MDNEKLLTISVAAYNVENTLGETLESLITDPAVMAKLEIIIVNDGSSDGTAEAAKRYADKYPGTFQLVNKENGGHGSTLNTSISLAHGKYWKMLDGDDWVETENLPSFIRFLEETDADLILTPYEKVWVDRSELVNSHSLSNGKVLDVSSVQEDQLLRLFAHEMAIRTSLLQDNGISMTEHCFYVDTELVYYSLYHTKTVAALDLPIYRYRLGVTGQSASIQGRLRHWEDAQRVEKRLLEHYYGNNECTNCAPAVRKSLYDIIFSFGIYQYQNFALMEDTAEARERASSFDSYLKQFPKFYRELGSSKLVKLERILRFHMLSCFRNTVSTIVKT